MSRMPRIRRSPASQLQYNRVRRSPASRNKTILFTGRRPHNCNTILFAGRRPHESTQSRSPVASFTKQNVLFAQVAGPTIAIQVFSPDPDKHQAETDSITDMVAIFDSSIADMKWERHWYCS